MINSSLTVDSEKLEHASNSLRELLPDCNSREAWVAETSVEYHRLSYLLENGGYDEPGPDSLLGVFLRFAPKITMSSNIKERATKTYKETFGHPIPYVWTVKVPLLTSDITAMAGMPGDGS